MRLFDDSQLTTSPVTVPRLNMHSRIFGGGVKAVMEGEEDEKRRRLSAPAPASNIMAYESGERKRKRTTNINPFTPSSILATLKKKARMASGESHAER